MGTLVLVRHGQASFGSSEYDKLSDKGERQALALGEHFARRGLTFEAVWSGPRARHVRTAEGAREGFARAGGSLAGMPAHFIANELDEMPIEAVIKEHIPRLVSEHEQVRDLYTAFQGGGGGRSFQKLLEEVTAMWIRGELDTPGVESFTSFRARVQRGLEAITSDGAKGRRILVVTSGGPIGAALQMALGGTEAAAAAHAWVVKNASMTELLFSGSRLTLSTFNVLPPFPSPDLETYR